MSVVVEQQTDSLPFGSSTPIPIAELIPSSGASEGAHIEAIVALIWPYSSSTQHISLLLAERNVRLRKSKGQIKVVFHGECAREVAKTQIGIGDLVRLGLKDATWTKTGEEVSTPGKKLDWDIDIREHVQLELTKQGSGTILVDFTAIPPPPSTTTANIDDLEGPRQNGYAEIRNISIAGTPYSPARHRTNRISSKTFVDASLDPFADDDGYIVGKGRKRTKFTSTGRSWLLLDDGEQTGQPDYTVTPSSPLTTDHVKRRDNVNENDNQQVVPDDSEYSAVEYPQLTENLDKPPLEDTTSSLTTTEPVHSSVLAAEESQLPMAPPATIPPTTPSKRQPPALRISPEPSISTPVLRPVPSPGLSLVSPLISRSGMTAGYFPFSSVSFLNADPDASSQAAIESNIATDGASPPAPLSTVVSTYGERDHGEDQANSDTDRDMNFGKDTGVDVVGTGQAQQNIVNEGFQHIFHQYPQLDSQVGSHADEFHEASTLNTIQVDLDGLEEQIDESNYNLDFPEVHLQAEDPDMYGPPISAELSLLSNAVTETSFAEQPSVWTQDRTTSQESPTERTTPHVIVDEEGPPATSEQMVHKLPHQSPVIIDSSADETSDDEHSEEDVSKDGNSEAGIVDVSAEPANNSSDDTTRNNAVTEFTTSIDVLSPSVPSQLSEQQVTSMDYVRSMGQALDGSNESIQNEAERRRFRETIQVKTAVAADAEALRLDVASNSVEVMSVALSDEDETEDNDDADLNDQVIAGDVLHVSDDERYESELEEASRIDSSPTPHASSAVMETLVSEANEQDVNGSAIALTEKDGETDTLGPSPLSIVAEQAIQRLQTNTFPDHMVPIPTKIGANSLLTPDATQEPLTSDNGLLPPLSPLPVTLPLSPRQTQDTLQETLAVLKEGTDVVESDQVGANEGTDEVTELDSVSRRTSKRLSRKSFTSEQLSTEYFTPRRSLRIRASSPLATVGQTSPPPQLTSPVQPRTRLRSSTPTALLPLSRPKTALQKASRGISTPLSYFPHLSTLQEYFNLQVDVLAVCTKDSTQPKQAKSGPKDYHTTLFVGDSSLVDSSSTLAQIFRPREEALPVAIRGDIILLRNMKVQTHDRRVQLLSTNASAWAVFKPIGDDNFDVITRGPPVEYEDAEKAVATQIMTWWSEVGEDKYAEQPVPSSPSVGRRNSRSTSPIVTRSQRRRADLVDESGSPSNQALGSDNSGVDRTSPDTDDAAFRKLNATSISPIASARYTATNPTASSPKAKTSAKRRGHYRANSERSEHNIHELRDGTKYIDDDDRSRSPSVIHELRDGRTYIDE